MVGQSVRVTEVLVRDYQPPDESEWLRCRVLAFLNTSYFNDVFTSKPSYKSPSIELTAHVDDHLVGLLDVAYEGQAATIETIAVLPEASRSGIGVGLLEEALGRLPDTVSELGAWTREDPAANAWYVKHGFSEKFSYLHVFASDEAESKTAVAAHRSGLIPVSGFFHAGRHQEEKLRSEFRRVHVCRQYVRNLV